MELINTCDSRISVLREWKWSKDSIVEDENNVLVVRDNWIGLKDNPWLPKETFEEGTNPYIHVYVYKKSIVIYDLNLNYTKYYPLLKQFGAIKHTQYGNPVVKISLVNNLKVKIVK
jgi:hypothetical protein